MQNVVDMWRSFKKDVVRCMSTSSSFAAFAAASRSCRFQKPSLFTNQNGMTRNHELAALAEHDEREAEGDAEAGEDEVVDARRRAPAAADLATHHDAKAQEEAGLDAQEHRHERPRHHARVHDLAHVDDEAHDLRHWRRDGFVRFRAAVALTRRRGHHRRAGATLNMRVGR